MNESTVIAAAPPRSETHSDPGGVMAGAVPHQRGKRFLYTPTETIVTRWHHVRMGFRGLVQMSQATRVITGRLLLRWR